MLNTQKFIIVVLLSCSSLWTMIDTAKILGVFPTQARSHYIVSKRLLLELAKSGHELTIITLVSSGTEKLPNNYNELYLEFDDLMGDGAKVFFENTDKNQITSGALKKFFGGLIETNRNILMHPKVQKLMKSNQKFDLLLYEIFMDEALLGLAHHFNVPVIGISTIGATRWVQEYTATPLPWSHTPHFALNYLDHMTFGQRCMNTFISLFDEYMLRFNFFPKLEEIYNEVFPDPKPNFYDLLHTKVSLVLLNSHISLNGPKPMMSNMIEVGGMHIDTKIKPLPKDMQEFIDSAEHGIIYFCLGSNVRPQYMHKEKKDAIIKVLSGMKEKIIWKFDDETLPVDKNKFYISKWMPQNDILANPKVKLFITHGGLLGTTEAVVHGVPLVGIPIMADQNLNMAKAEAAGYGVAVKYSNLTETSLKWAVNEVLQNSKYTNTMKELSNRFKDRPQDALETAKFWVEYVIRNKGAYYLQSPALKLNTIELYNLDVYGTLLVLVHLIIYLCYRLLKFTLCALFGDKKKKKHVKKSKNE